MAAPRTRSTSTRPKADTPNVEITVKATPTEDIRISLVGQMYTIHPPKSALGLALSRSAKSMTSAETREEQIDAAGQISDALDDWIMAAFGVGLAPKIQARLADPKDLLDIDHINQLMAALTARATGNPTT
jgi:hypothetical protein